jgi:hypothetical protein
MPPRFIIWSILPDDLACEFGSQLVNFLPIKIEPERIASCLEPTVDSGSEMNKPAASVAQQPAIVRTAVIAFETETFEERAPFKSLHGRIAVSLSSVEKARDGGETGSASTMRGPVIRDSGPCLNVTAR